jgi:hypothetical protein
MPATSSMPPSPASTLSAATASTYVADLKVRFKPKRNFMNLLEA